MSAVEFDNLIFALTESIIEAQSLVEINQIQRISSRYFDSSGVPASLELTLPSLDQDGGERRYSVPWLSLVPHGSLVIKEADIAFDVDISSITENSEEWERDQKAELLVKEAVESFKKEIIRIEGDNLEPKELLEQMNSLVNSWLKGKDSRKLSVLELGNYYKRKDITDRINYLKSKVDEYLNQFPRIKVKPKIMVDPSSGGIASKKGNAAKIQIKLGATEISEGMARLLNDVVKGQGHHE